MRVLGTAKCCCFQWNPRSRPCAGITAANAGPDLQKIELCYFLVFVLAVSKSTIFLALQNKVNTSLHSSLFQ